MEKRKKILEIVLQTFLFSFAILSWYAVSRALTVPDSSTWLVPGVFFSLFFVAIALALALVRSSLEIEIVLALAIFASAIFAPYLWHLAILVFASMLALNGAGRIRKDFDLNIKISIFKSLAVGKNWIIFALALAVSSQYFFMLKNFDGEKKIPQLDLRPIAEKVTVPLLKIVNPGISLENNADEDLTVDEFILLNEKQSSLDFGDRLANDARSNLEQQLEGMDEGERQKFLEQNDRMILEAKHGAEEASHQIALVEGRRQLSQLAGKNLSGSEQMSEVFAGLIEKKLSDFASPKVLGGKNISTLPLIFALILFLTIFPLGITLSFFWVLLAKFIFWILIKAGAVHVEKVTTEKEVIM